MSENDEKPLEANAAENDAAKELSDEDLDGVAGGYDDYRDYGLTAPKEVSVGPADPTLDE